MIGAIDRKKVRGRIRRRVRRKIRGTAQCPRMAVFRSNKHIYVQAIDDVAGRTLAQASTLDKEVRGKLKSGCTVEAAKAVGSTLAGRLKQAGVGEAVFDRGGFIYHGRVRAVAEAMRSEGLKL